MGKISKTSTFLSILGVAGVVATAIMTAKATPKALKLVEEAEHDKGEELTKLETVKAAAPAYIPTAIVGVSTIACIMGANVLNKKAQASIMSAYALLDSSYGKYRKKVNDIYGEDANATIIEELEEDESYVDDDSDEEKLFFDNTTLKQFRARMKDVIQKVELEGGMECYIVCTPPEFMMN